MLNKFLKRIVISTFVFVAAFSALPASIPALAQTSVTAEAAEIEPRADVIYWRYRVLANGTIQKRRWNETKGYWVDPDWINVT